MEDDELSPMHVLHGSICRTIGSISDRFHSTKVYILAIQTYNKVSSSEFDVRLVLCLLS